MKNVYLYKLANYLHTIKREKFKVLNFDREKLDCFNVNIAVIEQFKNCKPLESLDGYSELPDVIKKKIEENKESIKNECLDLLGVYVAPTCKDKGNILLSKEKISDAAASNQIDFDCLYNFVKLHEYAHASMCERLWEIGNDICQVHKDAGYVLIEESLATAIALKMMKNIPDYGKLEKFVSKQPFEYRYGLELLQEHSENIEDLMKIWKMKKRVCCQKEAGLDMLKFILGGFNANDLQSMENELVIQAVKYGIDDFLSEAAKEMFVF